MSLHKGEIHIGILIAALVAAIVGTMFIYTNIVASNQDTNIFTEITKPITNIKKSTPDTEPTTKGLLMFRGNPTRSYYGTGPLSTNPEILFTYPQKPMCMNSTVRNITHIWCGSGWTGQPVVWENPKTGRTEIIFGAYDGAVHFVDADTGTDVRPKFQTGDIIKGSVSLDPDGYPLIYFGSRDNNIRVVALDRDVPTEIWHINADHDRGLWNNDWDGNPIIEKDIMYEGGENGYFYIVKLNRSYDIDGKVSVDPKFLFTMPSYNETLLKNIGDTDVSIENSPAKFGDRVYFANSGGRIIGLDVSNVLDGVAPIVFDYWTGDDTDASVVVDDKGMLYVSSEDERTNTASVEQKKINGQLMKLDPTNPTNPLVWSVQVPREHGMGGGIWATPAIDDKYVYDVPNPGDLIIIDKLTGEVINKKYLGGPLWSSLNLIDGQLVITTCKGNVIAYNISDIKNLSEIWNVQIPSISCIESTPAIYKGNMYFGARDGFFYKFGDKK
ncbi:MAG: PQQ-binding-like beta-propeller repeat protein [Minisyncoccia bacterium]